MKKHISIFSRLSSLLVVSLAFSFFASSSGINSIMEHCDMMMEEMPVSNHHSGNEEDMEHCPMSGTSEEIPAETSHCEMEMSICGCEFQLVNSFATLTHTIKLNPPVLPVFKLISVLTPPEISEPPPLPVYFSSSYTSPRLFLANESFLI